MARPDFRGTAARRLAEERDLSPNIISLLSPEGSQRATGVRQIPVDRIEPNPNQPRMTFDEEALAELAASIREHGVLQPVLVRPAPGDGHRYQLVAGERRWRASQLAGLREVPALIEQIDDDTALEIALIENLQREDLSPLEEALMYQRMTDEHGYSVRKLAQKIGKDKGYVENRLRLADAPTEIKQLVSLRKDTVSHAYELLKVDDPRKRRRLAEQVGRGELSLLKLRERIEGRARVARPDIAADEPDSQAAAATALDDEPAPSTERLRDVPAGDNALLEAKHSLNEALDDLATILRSPDALSQIGPVDRANLAKYLTIAKLRLENVITGLRLGEGNRP
ncbi:MAG: ParB/RepB/Spo0J family partition protein [Chloroflexota bacterium]|nr:ParB/RepB/Spo0J family partition protein [Chloroflexota bacterium]